MSSQRDFTVPDDGLTELRVRRSAGEVAGDVLVWAFTLFLITLMILGLVIATRWVY